MAMAESASHPDMILAKRGLSDALRMVAETSSRMARKGAVISNADARAAAEDYHTAGQRMALHAAAIIELVDADDRGEL